MSAPTCTEARGPVRTCVGCRRTGTQADLLRAVADGAGRLRIGAEGRRRSPGRGAYVHPVQKCLIAAVTRGGFERSFRRKLHLPEVAALLSLLPNAAQVPDGLAGAGPSGVGAMSHEDQE
jgi:uncharacterized protein